MQLNYFISVCLVVNASIDPEVQKFNKRALKIVEKEMANNPTECEKMYRNQPSIQLAAEAELALDKKIKQARSKEIQIEIKRFQRNLDGCSLRNNFIQNIITFYLSNFIKRKEN